MFYTGFSFLECVRCWCRYLCLADRNASDTVNLNSAIVNLFKCTEAASYKASIIRISDNFFFIERLLLSLPVHVNDKATLVVKISLKAKYMISLTFRPPMDARYSIISVYFASFDRLNSNAASNYNGMAFDMDGYTSLSPLYNNLNCNMFNIFAEC